MCVCMCGLGANRNSPWNGNGKHKRKSEGSPWLVLQLTQILDGRIDVPNGAGVARGGP